jgi:serine/threonine-protein kinase
VATLDVSDTRGDGYFLVMEYIEGANLAALLRHAIDAKERLPEPVVLRVVSDGLAGLGAAHDLTDERGERLHLVHRDVSPHNVMVGVDGISRLTDFGVASASRRLTSTRQGTFKGKVSYSAPEQVPARGERPRRSVRDDRPWGA